MPLRGAGAPGRAVPAAGGARPPADPPLPGAHGPPSPARGAGRRGQAFTPEHARDFTFGTGGAESNAAIGAARLGAPVTWIGRVGSDAAGDLVVRRLGAEGIQTMAVRPPSPASWSATTAPPPWPMSNTTAPDRPAPASPHATSRSSGPEGRDPASHRHHSGPQRLRPPGSRGRGRRGEGERRTREHRREPPEQALGPGHRLA
ncbi:PfkB family carbohydrate kinase [Streptomyces sp. b94]|uniref:PfkB family carbohydrate kinase n=1 Tax=Streptomyces sp. b94 TaxID=1827634 RepID=UPI001FFCEDA2|nr:PfkB family carbohydrate kinase [Streptomyces sp. b94]